jgi:hypothetical protein
VERGKITFTLKPGIDDGIAESLEDFKQGRCYGPFAAHEAFLTSLLAEARRWRAKRPKRSAA